MTHHITYGIHDTEIGPLVIGQTDHGICWIGYMVEGYKGNGLDRMKDFFSDSTFTEDPKVTTKTADAIIAAWKNDDLNSLTLDIQGTDFQKSVWTALLDIPKGSTCSYGDVAKAIGNPAASRAVGSAVGENPISVIIPCHRVVQSTGALGNYGWGLDIKEKLLELEAENIPHGVQAA